MKLTRILTLTTALLGAASAASAQTVEPSPTPTIITSAPYTITTPGYYQLGANLSVSTASGAIITCAVGNVTLDFAGHYISGPSDTTSVTNGTLIGVYASERGNIKVLNGTVAYCQTGIEFNGTGQTGSLNVNQTVNNMLVTYCSNIGVFFNNANFSSVRNCNVTNIGGTTAAGITDNYGIDVIGKGAVLDNNVVNTVATVAGAANSGVCFNTSGSTTTAVVTNCQAFNASLGFNLAGLEVEDAGCLINGVAGTAAVGTRVGDQNNF